MPIFEIGIFVVGMAIVLVSGVSTGADCNERLRKKANSKKKSASKK